MVITLARTITLYIAIIVSVRIMGKRQIGELQANELVVTIMISELAAIPLQDLNRPILNGIVAIFTLVILELTLSAIALKSSKARRVISGRPAVVINQGHIDQAEMKKIRMSIDDLMENLRQQSIFEVEDVNFAIVETNGKLSVLLKPEKLPADASMTGKVPEDKGLRCVVINDGVIQPHSLPFTSLTKDKLEDLLKQKRIELKDVFLMTADQSKDYLIIKREKE